MTLTQFGDLEVRYKRPNVVGPRGTLRAAEMYQGLLREVSTFNWLICPRTILYCLVDPSNHFPRSRFWLFWFAVVLFAWFL
jgi:hypothetical protein